MKSGRSFHACTCWAAVISAAFLLNREGVSAQGNGSFEELAAATESEWGGDRAGRFHGDPNRDPSLHFTGWQETFLFGAESLQRFLNAWSSLLSGKPSDSVHRPIQIAHFGGSHVQAGRIGWSFRQRLTSDFPGIVVGRGVQPPHRLVGTNGAPERGWSSDDEWNRFSCAHRRHEGEWGITGMEARCDSLTGALTCWTGEPAGADCASAVRLFSRPGASGPWQLVEDGLDSLGNVNQADRGIHTWRMKAGRAPEDTLRFEHSAGMPAILHGVEWIPDSVDCIFHDLGANGAHSASWLRNPHFPEQLEAVAPDLVILAFGINDAHMAPGRFESNRFKRHYRQLLDTLRQASPSSEILLVTNNDSHYRHRHNPHAEQVRHAMLELVKTEGVACWDLYGQLGGRGSIDQLHATGFAADDRLHLRRDGYILIGEMLYELLARAAGEMALQNP